MKYDIFLAVGPSYIHKSPIKSTMNKHELNKYIATIIVSIGRSGRPNSYVWMDVDPNMDNLDRYTMIMGALVEGELVKNSGHFLTLLPKGLETLAKLEVLYAPAVLDKMREQALQTEDGPAASGGDK